MAAPTTHRSGIARYTAIQQADAFKAASLPVSLKIELAAIRAANGAEAAGKAGNAADIARTGTSSGFTEALANAMHADDRSRQLSGFRPLARFSVRDDE